MIEVSVVRDGAGFIRQLTVEGHAEYAEPGADIICSAASVTAYTAAGALEELAGIRGTYTENDGFFFLSIPVDITEEQRRVAGIILETAVIGFKQIELAHREYLTVLEEEV